MLLSNYLLINFFFQKGDNIKTTREQVIDFVNIRLSLGFIILILFVCVC